MADDGTKEYWTTLRTFTNQVAESGIPNANLFASVDWGGELPDEIEIRFDPLTTSGSPAIVYFNVWRFLGNKIDKLYRCEYGSDDMAAPIPVNLKFDAEIVWVTADFSGGTSPNVTTVCQYRIIK